MKSKILYLFIVLIGLLLCFAKISKFKQDGVVYLSSGHGLSNLSIELKKNQLIYSRLYFRALSEILVKIYKLNNIKFGEYQVIKDESYLHFLRKVNSGDVIKYSISFPEGLETREIVDIINKNNILIGDNIEPLKEGYLMPETYFFARGTTKRQLLERMENDMLIFVNKHFATKDKGCELSNINDVLKLASIVQKELFLPQEAKTIARLYLNRLKSNMRLQADPTTIYEITRGKFALKRPLFYKDLQTKGEYNTYQKFGLPATPINNPGKVAILAVLYPDDNDYLYFVVSDKLDGSHIFSRTYDEHLLNVKNYRLSLNKKH